MGMESYNLLFLHEDSKIVQDKEFWRLSGISGVAASQIQKLLAETCRQVTEEEWVCDECIDILVHHKDGWFQGLELRGCLAYFDKGIKQVYDCYELWGKTLPLHIYIMNQPVQAIDFNGFRDLVAEAYAEKMEWFRRAYGDIEWKVSSGAFYQEARKRQSLWCSLYRYFCKGK